MRRWPGIFLFLLLFLFISFISGQGFPSSSADSRPVIVRITVQVDGQEDDDVMKELVSIQEGEIFSLKNITESIRQIYQTGLISDARVSKEGEDRIHLTYMLTRRLFVGKVDFAGGKGISPKRLKDGLYSLLPEGHFSEDKLERAQEELKEVLKREGYFHADVKASVDHGPKSSSVDVRFEISSGRRYSIKEISFLGDMVFPEPELRKIVQSREGGIYKPSLIDLDISKLKEKFNSAGYQRAEIGLAGEDYDDSGGSVSLSFRIVPNERISIHIRGADVPISVVRPIWEERIFEEWGLVEGEARILSHLRKKGYIFAAVKSRLDREDSVASVIHDITPGDKYKIQDISFEGMTYFTSSQLKEELGMTERILFFGLTDGERLFELPREIELLYQTKGFSGARVDMNSSTQGKKVSVVYSIEEGPQERIKTIAINGATLFSPDTLKSQLNISEGGPFFQPYLQKEVEKLEVFYLNQGMKGTSVAARVEHEGDNLFSLVFDIQEGRRVRIDRVIIAGNVVTRRSTVERELEVKEGDYAFYSSLLETKRNLERLGIFSEVKVEEIPVALDRENLVISLREGERHYASLGIGLETKNEPRTFAIWNTIVRPRGTAEFMRSNILGTASQISFISQFSLKEKRGVISWEQPYFFGMPIRTYMNAWLEREERKSFSFDRRGISLSGIKQVSPDLVLLSTLRWARTILTFLEISESAVDRQFFPFSATSLSGSLIRDKRDDSFNPERGSFMSFVVEWAYPLFRAESDYLKSFIKLQHISPILGNLNLSSTFRLGLGMGRMPIHERFFAGGSNSFRGEEFDELGPKDSNSLKPVGGKALVLFNFEFKFPLSSALKNLSGAVFYDLGNVFAKRSQFDLEALRDAVGIGIRYRTPLGPLRFDLAWNLEAPERKGKPLAFITIGNVF